MICFFKRILRSIKNYFSKDCRDYYGRRIKKPRLFKITTTSDIWSHFYGVISLVALVITVIYTYFAFKDGVKETESSRIILFLSSSLIILIIVYIFSTKYFSKQILQLSKIPDDYQFLKEEKDRFDIVLNQVSECSHIITHYYRNINIRFTQFLNKPDDYSNEEILQIIDRFEYFLINVTSNLQSYFTLITNDNCSVTIKLLDNQTGNVKTFFRDPINFKKRKNADEFNNGSCHFSENTAFEIIISEKYSNIYFSEDDLIELHDMFQYRNPNPIWFKYYHSTIVVPISLLIEKKERNIIGFLSVDNFKGNLASNSNKEYLFFISDLLYCAFDNFGKIIAYAKNKGLDNEKIRRF